MCGVVGFWRSSGVGREAMDAEVGAMASALHLRGPDGEGRWCEPDAGLALGHRRLSIFDLSEGGAQPMRSASGRYVVTYNGEVYNFLTLRAELERLGATFHTECDTEVMLAAFEAWGVEGALERFNGMFAFALWDRRERALWLARDRLGIKPLYWGVSGGTLLFGSELKALCAHPSFQGRVSQDALSFFLRFNYIPAPWCIFEGIAQLPPGHVVRIGDPAAPGRPRPWWSAREVARRGALEPWRGDAVEARRRLGELLGDAVRLRMAADVPLGAFLSGGVDSSAVVALMQAQSDRPIKTFTIGFSEAGFNEAPHARQVAEALGTEHTELILEAAQAREMIPELTRHWDEPFADVSQLPTLLVSRLARQHVTVALSGDGGDELFGGYRRYRTREAELAWIERVPSGLRRQAAGMARRLEGDRLLGERFDAPGWVGAAHRWLALIEGDPRQRLYLRQMSYWHDPGELLPGLDEPDSAFCDPTLSDEHPGWLERRMFLDSVFYLPGDILTKVDRASMAVSLEARVPMLDHRVFEFAWGLPRAVRVGAIGSKAMLKEVLGEHLPLGLIERPKQGFGVPIGEWLRGPLRPWAEELLSVASLRDAGLLAVEPVRRQWAAFLAGRDPDDLRIWGLLMLHDWWRRWGTSKAAG